MRIVKDPRVRKQEIIDTSLVVFAEKGYEKTSISDIAKAMNISQGLCYRYFRSKGEIYDAALEEYADVMVANCMENIPEGSGMDSWMNNIGKGCPTSESISNDVSKAWTWECVWPDTNGVPTMRIGQVLTKAEKGLPEMWNAASMAVTYPMSNDEGKGLVNLIDPTVAQTAALEITTGNFPTEYGFTVGPTGNCTLRKGKYYFTGCPPSVSERF